MEPRSLKFIATACAGALARGEPENLVQGIGTDSRQVQPGELFVALTGERFDGHSFLPEVARRGAGAVMVDRARPIPPLPGCAVITVDHTRAALGRLASRYREDFSLPIIAVGGSNGKTTTKEFVAAVLREKFETLSSPASFNNDIGVPLTLLQLKTSIQAAVPEVGTNHPGELTPLVRLISPACGIITSIGREHLEFFGDLSGVVAEEGRLAELLPAQGKLFVNGDSAELSGIHRRTAATVVRVGFGEQNDWRVREIEWTESGLKFFIDAPAPEFAGDYSIRLWGRHQVVNALLALAVGREFGLTRDQIHAGLAGCVGPKMRLQLWRVEEVQVLDDSYNANADSTRAALETLREFPCRGRRIAVLGDMAELGRHGPAAHTEIGERAAQTGVGHLFAVGQMALIMGRAARAAGLQAVHEFSEVEAAAGALRDFVRPGDVVLLKASRSTRLERVGDVLRTLKPS